MEEKKSNIKFLWYVLFAFITVLLCYMFIVVYFYFISPYNISLKLGLWPFVSDQTVGEMYLDATVEIDFKIKNPVDFEEEEKKVVGVNIRADGYVVAPFNEFRGCDETTDIKILTNYGKIYGGKILYSEENFNLTVLKCESLAGNEKIKIPFVRLSSSLNSIDKNTEIVAVSSPLQSKSIWSGAILGNSHVNVYKEILMDSNYVVDFFVENCCKVAINTSDETFAGGAVFDKTGGFLGLSIGGPLEEDGNNIVMPVGGAKLFINNVVKNYKNDTIYTHELVDNLVGFDRNELNCFITVSEQNLNKAIFYFENSWHTFSNDIINYSTSAVLGVYLFEDFSYNESKLLNANSVIVSVKLNNKTYQIETKTDLLNVLYKMKKGDNVTAFYTFVDSFDTQIEDVSWIV